MRPGGDGYLPSGHAADTVAEHRIGSDTRPLGTGDATSRSSMAGDRKGQSVARGKTSGGNQVRRKQDCRVSSRSSTVRAAQQCAMSADTGWKALHASRDALLGLEYIDVISASQTGLHHSQAGKLLLPFSGSAPTLTEAVL